MYLGYDEYVDFVAPTAIVFLALEGETTDLKLPQYAECAQAP